MTNFESTVSSLLLDPLLVSAPVVDGKKVLPPVALEHLLGEGAMGAVYRGTHLELKIDVAVKCLKPSLVSQSEQFEARFRREANLAARLSHQNLVRLYELRNTHGLAYLVLEFVDGETIEDRVKRKGPHSPVEAAKIMLAAARGLAEAHRHPEVIIHRDFKPANLLISKRGQVKVADLGLAKAMESSGNASIQTMGLVGTPRYMAPEQWEPGASVSPRTDVWAMGATLYYLLTGQTAMQGNSVSQIAYEAVNQDFPDVTLLREGLPDELVRILERCTERDPSDRYSDAWELAKDLQEFLRALRTEPNELPPPPIPFWRRGKSQLGAAALLLLVALVVWGPFSQRNSEAGRSANKGYSLTGSGNPPTPFNVHSPTEAKFPRGWDVVDGTPGIDGWATLVREPRTQLEFRLIPRGIFMMGSPEDEEGRDDDETQHQVELTNAFYIAVTEFAGGHAANLAGQDHSGSPDLDLPVVKFTWDEARDVCELIDCDLPTEAQWEFAARGGTTTRYWWGDDPLGGEGKCNVDGANVGFNDGVNETARVAFFDPDSRGLWDLTGNVWEWCRDGYRDDYTGERRVDPIIDPSGDRRIVRGGSWSCGPDQCRVAERMSLSKSMKDKQIGFRPVLTLF